MSNFIQYSSNYFDYFKTFKYNAKLLKAHLHNLIQIKLANEILENATTAVLLKYLSNVWISHKVSLINCRFELKPKRTKHFVSSVLGKKNGDAIYDNVIFTIKDTKLYSCRHSLSTR